MIFDDFGKIFEFLAKFVDCPGRNLLGGFPLGPTNPSSGGWRVAGGVWWVAGGGKFCIVAQRVFEKFWENINFMKKKSGLLTYVFNVFLAEHFLYLVHSLEGLFLTKKSL